MASTTFAVRKVIVTPVQAVNRSYATAEVLDRHIDLEELADQLDVSRRVLTAGESKGNCPTGKLPIGASFLGYFRACCIAWLATT